MAALAPLCGAKAAPWDADSIASVLSGRELQPIEGVWQFPADGARMLICRQSASTYKIVLLQSPLLDVEPGTEIGIATATPAEGRYDVSLDSRKLANQRVKKAYAVFTINADGNLAIEPYSKGKKVTLQRWLPYFFRISVTDHTQPSGLAGAMRVYPASKTNRRPIL